MIILIDTRETKPLRFYKKWENVSGSERFCLSRQGDYAVRFSDGYIPPVRVERKQNKELYGNLGVGMDRFRKEINNCIDNKLMLYLFIEGTQDEFLEGSRYSKMKPQSILRTINTLEVKHGVIHKFYPTRGEMARAIYELFYSIGKRYHADKKSKDKK